MEKLGKALLWEELAEIYNLAHSGAGRPAMTLPMEQVFDWAERQKDKFRVDKEGSIHKITKEA